MNGNFFFDTYALVELLKGNPAYERFREAPIITHFYNLYELSYQLLKDFDEHVVRKILNDLNSNLLEPELDDIFRASYFKRAHLRIKISYVDALGYTLAQKHGLKFLTGDEKFRGMENVEYVP